MPLPWSRLLRALFVAYVAATAIHIGYIVAHEPFSFDAWNVAVDTDARPFSLGRLVDYWTYELVHSNPRVGQALTYCAYKLEYFSVIATPLAFLAIALAVTTLGLGRRPRWSRGRDLALVAIAIGFAWFAFPQLGKTMFNRAYCANYLYGAAIQLWFVVALLHVDDRPNPAWWPLYALFGAVAGACNEHTGPTLCVFAVGCAAFAPPWRRGKTIAAAVGAVAGFALLFFAPGQEERYDGLAQRVGLFGRLAQRWITGDLEILRDLVLAAAPLLGLLAIVLVRGDEPVDAPARARRRDAALIVAYALAASVLVAITLFVSPKLGPRFFLAGLALVLAGFIATVDARLRTAALVPLVVLAGLASTYAATRTVALYGRLAHDGERRLAALEASRRGTVFTAESFEQVDDSWWFLGDDFRDVRKRELVARYFDLAGVVFRAYDPNAPLGVSDVRLVPRATLSPSSCLDDHGGLELGYYKGIDVASIHKALVPAIAALRARLGAVQLDALELAVEFAGEPPKLPRARAIVARWRLAHPDQVDGWAATIVRRTRAPRRDVEVPVELAARDLEMFAYHVGGEARRLGSSRDRGLGFVPWQAGAYWVLACGADACFVVAAARMAR